MHIHGAHMNPNILNLYAAAASAKTASAQRAAEVRKKLASSAAMIEGELDDDGVFMIGQEPQEKSRQRQQKDPRAATKKPDAEDDDQSGEPISTWA
jgi:hypothetical protein